MSNPLGAAVVGYGPGGLVHAALLSVNPFFELRYVVTRSGARADLVRSRFPSVRVVGFEECLSDPTVHLVAIATPNDSHFELAQAALKAGRHVVIDKPVAVTSPEVQRLMEIADSNKRLLIPFHNRRWDSDFLTVQSLLVKGELGKIRTFISRYCIDRPLVGEGWREQPRPGSGLLYDIGPHLIDQALLIFGPPAALSAQLFQRRTHALVDDGFHIALDYPDVRVELQSDLSEYSREPRFEVHGELGSFTKFGLDMQNRRLLDGALPTDDGFGVESSDFYGTLATDKTRRVTSERGSYVSFYQGVAQSLLVGEPAPVDARTGYQTIAIIEAALKSASEGHAVAL